MKSLDQSRYPLRKTEHTCKTGHPNGTKTLDTTDFSSRNFGYFFSFPYESRSLSCFFYCTACFFCFLGNPCSFFFDFNTFVDNHLGVSHCCLRKAKERFSKTKKKIKGKHGKDINPEVFDDHRNLTYSEVFDNQVGDKDSNNEFIKDFNLMLIVMKELLKSKFTNNQNEKEENKIRNDRINKMLNFGERAAMFVCFKEMLKIFFFLFID